jgi:serine/threonine-protein kinase HipA
VSGRRAKVLLDGELAGWLQESDGQREISFRYDSAWLNRPDAAPVSLTLPLTEEVTTTRGLHPFFENLLAEGWLFDLTLTKLRVSKDDEFGILLATCADTVGAVGIERVEDEQLEDDRREEPR